MKTCEEIEEEPLLSKFLKPQTDFIKPVWPQAAQQGIFWGVNFTSFMDTVHLIEGLSMILLWHKVREEKIQEEEKSPAPGGFQILDLMITRQVLHRCTATTDRLLQKLVADKIPKTSHWMAGVQNSLCPMLHR